MWAEANGRVVAPWPVAERLAWHWSSPVTTLATHVGLSLPRARGSAGGIATWALHLLPLAPARLVISVLRPRLC